jgi:hypothetical protein
MATYVRTRDGTPARDFVLDPATFNDAYEYGLSALAPYTRGAGKAPFVHIGKMANVFSSYRFSESAPSFLHRARIGGGANYRGPAVIGYDSANNDAVIRGKSSVMANLMLGRAIPLRRGQVLDLQVNIDNLFTNEEPLPYSASAPGKVVRSILPRVRHGWNLRATYTF